MANIPMGQFAQATAIPQASRIQVDTSPTDSHGAGAGAIAQGLGDVANAALQEQQRREQQADALSRVEAYNASSEYELQVAATGEQFARDMEQGRVTWRDANDEWAKRVQGIEAPQPPPEASPQVRLQMERGIRQTQVKARLKVDGLAAEGQKSYFQTQATEALNKNIMAAGMPGGSTEQAIARNNQLVPLLREAGFDEARAADIVNKGNQAVITNEVKNRAGAATGNVEQLQQILTDLTDEDGRYVSTIENPDTRLDLANAVRIKINQAQSAIEQQKDKREAAAGRVVGQVWEQATSGLLPTTEMVTGWGAAVSGTTYEPEFREAVKLLTDVQGVLRAPKLDQDEYLAEQRRQLAGGGTTDQLARIEKVQKVIEGNQKLREESPLAWQESMTGQPVERIDFPAIQAGGDASLLRGVVDSRIADITALRGRYGPAVQMNPLLPQEADVLSKLVSISPPDKLMETFKTLRSGTGSDMAYRAMMQQIAPNAPVKVYAGIMASQPGGEKIASVMLYGQALLDPPDGSKARFQMPPDSKFEAIFAETVGDAYTGRPEDYQRDFAAFRAAYAGYAARAGNSAASQELDETLAPSAIRAVIGNVAEFGGKEVIPPWQMPADEFEDKADTLVSHALTTAGLKDRSGISLVAMGQPGYYMLYNGIVPVMDPKRTRPDGTPAALYINFNQPLPTSYQPKEVRLQLDAAQATLRGTR